MKKVTIVIETTNAAFQQSVSYEVNRIVNEITRKGLYVVTRGYDSETIPLKDINGNTVGSLTVER